MGEAGGQQSFQRRCAIESLPKKPLYGKNYSAKSVFLFKKGNVMLCLNLSCIYCNTFHTQFPFIYFFLCKCFIISFRKSISKA